MAMLARLYSRRIVNINVNIVLAGLLAMGPTALVAHLTHYIPHLTNALAITSIILLADALFDVAIYYVLHWLANHYPRKRQGPLGTVDLSFIRDASLVQFERAMLIPVFYGVTAGLSWWLLHFKLAERELATVISLLCGIFSTRIIHSIWMIRQERIRARELCLISRETQPAPAPPPGEPGIVPPPASTETDDTPTIAGSR